MPPFGLKPIPIESASCLMCDGPMLVGKTIDNRRLSHYAWCESCDFAQIYPMPSEEEIINYYVSGEYRRETFRYTHPNLEHDDEPQENNFHEEQERARGWQPYLSGAERHLDIGSSTGKILEIIGAPVQVGVEPGPWGREYGALESLDDVEGKFDLITCLHVIEHVTDPFSLLEQIHDLATGQVCIEVPKPPGWGWPHLTCFRNKSLLQAMDDAGMPATIVDDGFHIKALHEAGT